MPKPTTWNPDDIAMVVDTALDAFAGEFLGVPWSDVSDDQARNITGAIAAYCVELGKACKPIPYELTQKGLEYAAERKGKVQRAGV